MNKFRIALAATILALTAVSATTPASAGFGAFRGYVTLYYYPFP
jgi:hypothetical protein